MAQVRVSRPRAHGASGEESAPEAAFQVWGRLRAWADEYNHERERLFDQLLVRLDQISSGGDGFEEWAALRIAARLPVDLPPEAWFTRLEEIAAPDTVEPIGFPIAA